MNKPLQAWWGKRQPRERLLVFAACAGMFGLAVDSLALGPLRAEAKSVQASLVAAEAELAQLRAGAEDQASKEEFITQGRLAALARRRELAEDKIAGSQTDFMSSQDMRFELAAILQRFPHLRVVSLRSAGSQRLTPRPAPAGGAPAAGGAAEAAPIALFEQGIVLSIEGPYLDQIGYLKALESAPYHIYWRGYELKVDEHGTPRTEVTFYTLSTEASWLSL